MAKATRLSIDLSGKMMDVVNGIADATGASKADVVRLSLLLLYEVRKSEAAGGYVAVVDSDGNKTRFILLG